MRPLTAFLLTTATGSLLATAPVAAARQQPARPAPHQPPHGGAHHGGAAHEQVNKLLTGFSDAEKHYVHQTLASMSAADRKTLLDRLTKLAPADRRKAVQQMMHAPKLGGHKPRHGSHSSELAPGALRVGEKVPDFSVVDLNGKARKLSDLQKQSPSSVVSLTFWCSFCHSCRDVEEKLDQFAGKQKDRAMVLAVDASAGETADGVKAFVKRRGLALPIYLDGPGKTADLFGVRVTTTTVIIDGKGILRYRGQFAGDLHGYAEEALAAVLAGKPVATKETPLQG